MDLTQKSDAEILAVANPIMDNLMDASTAIDYARHTRDFTDRAKSALSKESLQSICEYYQSTKGFFARREFVAELVLVQCGGKYLVDHVMVF